MYDQSFVDLPIEQFGGYCPAIPPSQLPQGASSLCQDVEFPEASVRTRGGLFNYFGVPASGTNALPVNAAVNGLKSYLTPTQLKRLLAWDSLGNLYKENPTGTLAQIFQRPQGAGTLYQSNTLFGREYQAFFDANGGRDIPRQYDDTNWDRVSQDGPGAAPIVADEAPYNMAASVSGATGTSPAIVAQFGAATAIATIAQSGNLVTVTLGSYANFAVFNNESVTIAGVSPSAYNGTFKVQWVGGQRPTAAPGAFVAPISFTYVLPFANLAAGSGGTAVSNAAVFSLALPTFRNFTGNFDGYIAQFLAGISITVAGVTVAGYNGTWQTIGLMLWSTPCGGFTCYGPAIVANLNVSGLANSANGTVTVVGNVAAGIHNVSLSFINRQGFITKQAVPGKYTSAGNKRAVLTQIAIGPSNVVARLLTFTPVITPPATTGSFYSLPTGSPQVASSTMLISNNTNTTAAVDFTDAILIAGFQANYLFTQRTLGECAFVGGYDYRNLFLGERVSVQNLINLGFDGGGPLPLGWSQTPSSTGGVVTEFISDWLGAYQITGDGVTGIRGLITQPAAIDYLGVPVISPRTSYSVRVRMRSNAVSTVGAININLTSVVGGFTTPGLSVAANTLSQTQFVEYTAELIPSSQILNSTPPDLTLQVYSSALMDGNVYIDSIEIFQTNLQYNYSTAWLSHAFNPESFDNTTSQIQVRPGDGQQLRCGAPLRNSYYLLKDHYMGYVTDDGVNEPSSWTFTEVSATVGGCGPNAIDWTEEWFTFAERSGAYICWGGDPVKLTQEIQEDASGTGKITWNSINWLYGHTIVVRIDQKQKRIFYAVPVNGATSPNCVFVLDYKWLNSPQDISDNPMVTYSAFTGKILSHGRGRRWTYWNMTVNSMCFYERADNTAHPFFGNGLANGKIYQLKLSQLSDDGNPINSLYWTYFAPSHIEEQMLKFGAVRKVLGYLTWRVIGAGSLLFAIQSANRVTNLRSYTLSVFPVADGERALDLHGQRFSIQVGTNAVNAWFQLEHLILFLKKDAAIAVRGANS